MNNENGGEEEEDGQMESFLNDSINSSSKTGHAVDENASESLKRPNSKIFQLQMDEIGSRIRDTEEKLKSHGKQVLPCRGRINKSAAPVDKEKLHEELQNLPTQREKVIAERKQCHLELKGLNDQVRKKSQEFGVEEQPLLDKFEYFHYLLDVMDKLHVNHLSELKADTVPHSCSQVGKTARSKQRESAPVHSQIVSHIYSCLEVGKTESNEQTESASVV